MNMQIYSKNHDLNQEIRNYIQEKIGGLTKFLDNVIDVKVEASKSTQHHENGDYYMVEVNIKVPGRLMRAVSEKESLFAAVDEVREELVREMNKLKGKRESLMLRGARMWKDIRSVDPLAWFRRRKRG